MLTKITTTNFENDDVKVYSITESSASINSLPDWVQKKHQNRLKKDFDYSRRIELLQDFSFPEASLKIKTTPDQQYILATGVYKPHMKVYDLSQLSMKFERHTDCDNVQFEVSFHLKIS
jgi:ribosome biogenesis protein ENP2